MKNQFTFNSKRFVSAAHVAFSPSPINLVSKIVDPSAKSRLIASALSPINLSYSGSLNFRSLVSIALVKHRSCPAAWCNKPPLITVFAGLAGLVRSPRRAARRWDYRLIGRLFPASCSELFAPPSRTSSTPPALRMNAGRSNALTPSASARRSTML